LQPNCGLFKTGLLVCWMAIAGLAVIPLAWAQTTDPVPVPGDTGTGFDTGTEGKKLKPIVIRTLQEMTFGRFSADSKLGGGQIIIDPVRGTKKGINVFGVDGKLGRSELEVTGEPNKRILITTPKKVIIKTDDGSEMEISHFTVHGTPLPVIVKDDQIIGTLGPDGRITLMLGATLTVGPKFKKGKVDAVMDIFIDYLPD